MIAEELLQRARAAGLTVERVGPRLLYKPKEGAPGALIDELRVHKGRIIGYLEGEVRTRPKCSVAALLAWAGELAQKEEVLPEPVTFVEAPKRTISTDSISWLAARYLRVICCARLQQSTGGGDGWQSHWWKQREEEALGALAALRLALDGRDKGQHSA